MMNKVQDFTNILQRRKNLFQKINFPVILWSGSSISRNFPANLFPFRANSHFLYLAGIPLENAAILLDNHQLTLFMDDPHPNSALWHGESPKCSDFAAQIGADNYFPLSELKKYSNNAATIAVGDLLTYNQQCEILNRKILPAFKSEGIDLELAQAIVSLRLSHDQAAINQLKQSANVSIEAHKVGMSIVSGARTEAEVRAAIESIIIAENMTCAYNSIVTVQGEVLHNNNYNNILNSGDLLLADVGAENQLGWAADITRTYPVSGQFSATQRDIYDLVLLAHDTCINQITPGVEYQDIHLSACQVITSGLIDLGILKGNIQDLVEMDAHALFFPHGIGHLLGLDVHDMEDLGDLAGYAEGRKRSERFGLCYLRLNRPLQSGMLITIEPGFYQVPAILNDPKNREKYQDVVNWEQLEKFADVRGIRIEDDVLVTDSGYEILTQDLPNKAEEVENLVNN